MALKDKTIKSRVTGITGKITGIDNKHLKITFSGFQDITVPLSKAEELLIMDEETISELKEKVKGVKEEKEESKVKTYIDTGDDSNN